MEIIRDADEEEDADIIIMKVADIIEDTMMIIIMNTMIDVPTQDHQDVIQEAEAVLDHVVEDHTREAEAAPAVHVPITDAQDLIPHDLDLVLSQIDVKEAHQSLNWSQH